MEVCVLVSLLSFDSDIPIKVKRTYLTTFSITLFELTPSALGIPEYPFDVPLGVNASRKIDR